MNIWVVNHYAVPPGQSGGTRHWVLGQHLRKAGHSVAIIAGNVNYHERASADADTDYRARLQEHGGIKFLWLNVPEYKGSLLRVLSMIVFALRTIFGRASGYLPRPDVIIGSTPHPFAAFAALVLARRFKAKFVLEVRDIWPESLVELGGYSWFHPFIVLLDQLEKLLARKADRIICLLPKAHDDLIRKGSHRDKITWIPNGVDLSLFTSPEPKKRDGDFIVMYAGAHGVANGLDVVLDAAALLQDRGCGGVTFVLVGNGTQKERLKANAAKRALANVVFKDSVPKNAIPAVLAAADACFMHLRDLPVFRWGVSPNKLFDYMGAARPVIFAVNTSVNPVENANAGLTIPPENPEALADAVMELAGCSDEERARMGAAGRAYVISEHGAEVLGERLSTLLADL
ncbi:MAG: glycosyltransferase family 4 protein [Parvibaculaceae bacterium]|nr:glycosyltransferase WbuB [Rhodobiaceae bacterium]MDF1625700.1 glycosyltransferase family 4 protein [Parvibaculaceae bacterium]